MSRTDATIRLTTAPAGGDYPNEPGGYTRFAAHDYSAMPTTANAIDGEWGTWESSNCAIVSDATEPIGPDSVIRLTYPAGLQEGYAPGIGFEGWDVVSDTSSTQKQAIYFHATVKIESGWVSPSSGIWKTFGFLGYSETGGAYNQATLALYGVGSLGSYQLQLRQQGTASGARNLGQNVDGTGYCTVGSWHGVEIVCVLNDVGSSNGVYKAWIDGNQVAEYSDVVYRNTTYPAGFVRYSMSPTWGGSSSQTVASNQYVRHGSIYMSGVAL